MTIHNPLFIRTIVGDPNFIGAELFPAESNGHKFKQGDVCTLVGLEDFPEFNGTEVMISQIRENAKHGKTYYIEGSIDKFLNWVYEYRLELKKS